MAAYKRRRTDQERLKILKGGYLFPEGVPWRRLHGSSPEIDRSRATGEREKSEVEKEEVEARDADGSTTHSDVHRWDPGKKSATMSPKIMRRNNIYLFFKKNWVKRNPASFEGVNRPLKLESNRSFQFQHQQWNI